MVWMDGKAALKKALPKSWIHTVSDFFGEAQMRHFCLSQMCFTIRLDTIEKDIHISFFLSTCIWN